MQGHASATMSCDAFARAKLESAASRLCGYLCVGHLALHLTGDVTQSKGKHLLGTLGPQGLWACRGRSKLWV